MSKVSTNKLSYEQRLSRIKQSVKVGDIIHCGMGYCNKWLKITSINKLDEPIPNRSNVTLSISAKRIDNNTVEHSEILYLADLVQFALVDEIS